MYDDVLIPTDGSTGAVNAARPALDLAERHDATVHALYVVEDEWADVAGEAIDPDAVAGRTVERIEEVAGGYGIDPETTVRTGRPHEEILACAEERDVDLIVMGTHGRTGLERYLVGSVAERVVRAAPVPVLTVRLTETPAVTDADRASELAREALADREHTGIAVAEPPSPQRKVWVTRATTDEGTYTVYVDRTTGEPHVVPAE